MTEIEAKAQTDLIARIESADGPDRELDALAHLVKFPDTKVMTDNGGYRSERPVQYTPARDLYPIWNGSGSDFADIISAPRYTASIDAALTLVPEGMAFTVARYWCEGEEAPPYYADCIDIELAKRGEDAPVYSAKAETPALAIAAAALKARGV